MQTSVLVTYGSRHGATAGIAKHIAAALRSHDVDATVLPVDAVRDADGYDGYVVGSAVYATHWLGPVKAFVHRNRSLLRRHPVWLFSSGPLTNDRVQVREAAPHDVEALEREVEGRGHQVFGGVWARDTEPIGLLETAMRVIPAAREALPAKDFRDWSAIDAFATGIAGELRLALETD